MQIEKLRSLIRESVKDHIKEIEAVAEAAAMDARLAEYDKAIKTCEDKITKAENLEEVKELVDEGKLNELKKKLKDLKKTKEKLEKAKAKKNKGKEVTTDAETDKMDEATDKMDETYVEETYTVDEMDMKDEALNESFLKMQKLAGVITEAQYNQKKSLVETQINEEKDINEFGKSLMDKLKKSGFDAKFVDNEVKKIELEKIVKDNPKKLAVVYFDKAINYVSIITNKDNQDEALKIAESSKSLLPDGYTVSKQGGYFVQIQPSLR
jgi:hypothetical protein